MTNKAAQDLARKKLLHQFLQLQIAVGNTSEPKDRIREHLLSSDFDLLAYMDFEKSRDVRGLGVLLSAVDSELKDILKNPETKVIMVHNSAGQRILEHAGDDEDWMVDVNKLFKSCIIFGYELILKRCITFHAS